MPLVDLSYLAEISGNDSFYIAEVVGIFIDTMNKGLPELEELVFSPTPDYDKIHQQAHFLKSSAGIVKVGGNYENFVKMNTTSLTHSGIEELRSCMVSIKNTYAEALTELESLRNPG